MLAAPWSWRVDVRGFARELPGAAMFAQRHTSCSVSLSPCVKY
jgi:hypothetical protein